MADYTFYVNDDKTLDHDYDFDTLLKYMDQNIFVVRFRLKKEWGDIDLSTFTPYINVTRSDSGKPQETCSAFAVDPDDPDYIYCDWTVTHYTTCIAGDISFRLHCVKTADEVEYEWHTEEYTTASVQAGSEPDGSGNCPPEFKAELRTLLENLRDAIKKKDDDKAIALLDLFLLDGGILS